MVRLMKPQGLLEAFEVAQLQEQSLEILFRKQKLSSLGKPSVSGHKTGSTYKVPVTAEPQPARNVRKISPQELQERREKGLCFKCGDKFGFGHQCAMKHLNFMLLDEEPDPGGDSTLNIEDSPHDMHNMHDIFPSIAVALYL